MTVNSTRDFIPPEPFEGQNYKPRYARPSASLREELPCLSRCPLLHTYHIAVDTWSSFQNVADKKKKQSNNA